jgi:rfaE bifunctional protein nucleotidyltransferase chain/domain/rfaE bifunctional protein kinase chain/domain
MSRTPLVVVGDCLLDRDLDGRVERLSPEAPVPVVENLDARPRAGGAGLAAVLAAADGRRVRLVTALGNDDAAAELRRLLGAAGVEVVDVGLRGPTPEKVRVRAQGRTLLRLDYGGRRPAAGEPVGPATLAASAAIRTAPAVLVSDYGEGMASEPAIRAALAALAGLRPLVWDPHPRGAAPVPGCRLVKPSRREAGGGDHLAAVARRARELRRAWRAEGVAITLGERGALLVTEEPVPLVAPVPRAAPHDACGAGDRFCSAAAGLLADGAGLAESVIGAVHAASAFVAAGGAAAAAGPDLDPVGAPGEGMAAALAVAAAVRGRGGRVVATGGCFDLLHAGHVGTLRAARELGDCLVVCLNSDASARRLKGDGRPLVPEADRAAVLEALGCVDAVVVFDEPTPEAVLRELRPDLFVKGGDYGGRDLPERAVLAEWDGEVVLLPQLAGRSTTRLMEEALRVVGD